MAQCSQAACRAFAPWYPVFVVAFSDGRRPRRIVAPFHVCAAHAQVIRREFLAPARRAALRERCGLPGEGIDWDRCRVEFVPSGGGVSERQHWPA